MEEFVSKELECQRFSNPDLSATMNDHHIVRDACMFHKTIRCQNLQDYIPRETVASGKLFTNAAIDRYGKYFQFGSFQLP